MGYLQEDWQAWAWASRKLKSPCLAKKALGHLMLSKPLEIPDWPCCLRTMLRRRRRIHPSSGAKVER